MIKVVWNVIPFIAEHNYTASFVLKYVFQSTTRNEHWLGFFSAVHVLM